MGPLGWLAEEKGKRKPADAPMLQEDEIEDAQTLEKGRCDDKERSG